jgi:hypothetical protein
MPSFDYPEGRAQSNDGIPSSPRLCRIAGLNLNNTVKPDKPIKPTVKQKCFSKVFYGKHN